jgi:uncharacterized membrane protein YphA (DoxX/SURF4 family)
MPTLLFSQSILLTRNNPMNLQNKWVKITGLVLNVLIGGLMILAGSGKAFGFAPPQIVEALTNAGLGDKIRLIGFGELTAALLLIVPRTSPFGALMTSGFWGGVICIHMAGHQDFIVPSVLLAVTWIGAYLRGSVRFLNQKGDAPQS